MHEGTTSVESDGPGHGSTFSVRLPAVEAPAPLEREVRSISAAEHQRVLVVDDNEAAASMFAMLLKTLGGHDLDIAHDGPSALQKISELRPDVVFLDIGLPSMDGFEVAREVRRKGDLDDVLLVALTGYGQEEDRQKSKEAGFDEHLVKPPSADQIREVFAHPKLKSEGRRERVPVSALSTSLPAERVEPPSTAESPAAADVPDSDLHQIKHDVGNTAHVLNMVMQMLSESAQSDEAIDMVRESLDQEIEALHRTAEMVQHLID